jgi:hypothetical protein
MAWRAGAGKPVTWAASEPCAGSGLFRDHGRKILEDIGIERFRRRDVGVAALAVIALLFREPAAVQRQRIVRIEPDGGGVVGDAAFVILLVVIGQRPVIPGPDVFGIEPDRLAEIGDRLIEIGRASAKLRQRCD